MILLANSICTWKEKKNDLNLFMLFFYMVEGLVLECKLFWNGVKCEICNLAEW